MVVPLNAKYARAVIVGAVFSLPILACIWLATFLRERAVADALSKGQGVLCAGLDTYLLFLLLIMAIFALAGIMSVKYASKLVGSAGEAGKTGGVAGATGVIVSIIIILAAEAFIQIGIDHSFSCLVAGGHRFSDHRIITLLPGARPYRRVHIRVQRRPLLQASPQGQAIMLITWSRTACSHTTRGTGAVLSAGG